MVLSFSVIGSLLAEQIFYDRILAIVVVYFLGLGIAAHALDALGSKGIKPWGTVFSKTQLWFVALVSLVFAYGIAIYYMIRFVPLLSVVAILEGFFVFAYNLEWFAGRFHTDRWFAFSWGSLPVLAGYIMQTNRISLPVLIVAISTALFSSVEIKASRPYKELKRRWPDYQRRGASPSTAVRDLSEMHQSRGHSPWRRAIAMEGRHTTTTIIYVKRTGNLT